MRSSDNHAAATAKPRPAIKTPRAKKVRTPKEGAAHREARLVAVQERQQRADPEYTATETENKRRQVDTAGHRERNAARMRALRQDPAYRRWCRRAKFNQGQPSGSHDTPSNLPA